MAKKQPINHVEFRTRDAARLKRFYGTLFGWKFEDEGGYTLVDTGNEKLGAGIFSIPADQPQITPGVTTYVQVKSLENAEARVRELGGDVLMSKHEVAGRGHFSTFLDPDGNAMAAWQDLDKKARKAAKKAAKKDKKKTKRG